MVRKLAGGMAGACRSQMLLLAKDMRKDSPRRGVPRLIADDQLEPLRRRTGPMEHKFRS